MSSNSTTSAFDANHYTVDYHVIRMIQFLFGMAGNILIILVIIKYKKLHLSGNMILISIAIADILNNLIAPSEILADYFYKSKNDDGYIIICYFFTFIGKKSFILYCFFLFYNFICLIATKLRTS